MDLKKLILATGLLAAVSVASVIETNDVKMNTLLGLGGNPAVIAVHKKVNFEAGSVAINQNKQNAKLQNGYLRAPTIGLTDGRNENDMNFMDASRFFWFAGNIGNDWFGIRHTNVSNVYPFFTSHIVLDGAAKALQNVVDPNKKAKVTIFRKDTVESFSLLWAKELSKGYSVGAELASNTYTLNDNRLYNTAAEQINHAALGGSPFADVNAFSASKAYYTLTLGLVKELDSVSKLSLAHKISQDRGIYYNDDAGKTYVYNESLPNESGLAYTYKVNDALEVAAVYKGFWGVSYQKNVLGSNNDYGEAITKHPYNSYGFATDYRPNEKWTLQTYGSFIRNYKKNEIGGQASVMDRGYKVTQIGGNIQYNMNVIKGGTILLGSYVTKLESEDADVGYLFDITNTTLSYSQNF